MTRFPWRRFLYSRLFDSLLLGLTLSVSLMSWLRIFFWVLRPWLYALVEAILALAATLLIATRVYEISQRRPQVNPYAIFPDPGEPAAGAADHSGR